jgi:hypothetical protein
MMQIINFGVTRQNKSNMPIFSLRREVDARHGSILWPFGAHSTVSMLNAISSIDTSFDSKHAKVMFRNGFRHDRVHAGLTHHFCEDDMSDIRNLLMFRYLIVTEEEECSGEDLMVSLFIFDSTSSIYRLLMVS